jgi:hypothetical protein
MEIGFDFNPTVDRIRIVSAQTGANYRLNPATGLVAATDNNLQWAAADVNATRSVRVSTMAYTNSYPNSLITTLNGVNDSGMVFVSINPPNNGQLNTVSSAIFGALPMSGTIDLDYFYDSTTTSNIGYIAANTGSATMDMLYTLSATGTPTLVDTIGYGLSVTDIAVMPQFKNAGVSVKGLNGIAPAVYPNPAGNAIQAVLPSAVANATPYRVVDITGREVAVGSIAASAKKVGISLAGIPGGVYVLWVDGYAPVRFSKL